MFYAVPLVSPNFLTLPGIRIFRDSPGIAGVSKTYQGSEVAPHAADLVLEDLVVEAGLELALASAGGGDVHGGLATAENDVVLLGSDTGAVERGVGGVGLQELEVAGGHEAGGLILGGGDEVSPVGRPLQVGDLLVQFVDGDVEVLLAGLETETERERAFG